LTFCIALCYHSYYYGYQIYQSLSLLSLTFSPVGYKPLAYYFKIL
jgi:hypothetical protein